MTSHETTPQTDDVTGAQIREHTFDGIQEFDNRLPNWWLWSLYVTVIFSVGYWIHYHTLGTGAHPTGEYEVASAKMAAEFEAEAAKQKVSDEILVGMSAQAATLAKGEQIFQASCVSCHGQELNGKSGGADAVGPNLTDKYFLHGGQPMDIYTTVKDGVTGTAMVSWESTLSKLGVMQVVAYVMSKVGTEVEGKAPDLSRAQLADLSWKTNR